MAGQAWGVPKDVDAGGPLIIRPKADTSRALPSLAPRKSQAPSQAEISAIETFVGSLEKSAAAIRAETEAYGRNSAERAIAINMVKAEEVAKQAGIKLTESQVARIREASTASAEYRDRLEDLRDQQEFARSAGGDFLQGFAADMREGASVTEALSSALSRLSSRLQDRALDQLADTLFGKSGGNSSGSFGGLSFAGLLSVGSPTGGVRLFADGVADLDVPAFADGGVIRGVGNGTSDSIIARVSNGESIMPARVTAKHLPLIRALVEDRLPRFAEAQVALAAASFRAPTFASDAYDAAARTVSAPAVRQSDVNIDLRGSSLTREEVLGALRRAMAEHDEQINRTMGERMENWRFNNALRR